MEDKLFFYDLDRDQKEFIRILPKRRTRLLRCQNHYAKN